MSSDQMLDDAELSSVDLPSSEQLAPLRELAGQSAYASKRLLFCAIVALQVFSLLGLGAQKAYTLTTGRVINLKTIPVDPTDMFRGDYVTLQYDGFPQQFRYNDPNPEQTHYVVIEKGLPYWRVVSSSSSKPVLAKDQLLIKGERSGYGWLGSLNDVDYGIGRYYVAEGKGLELEKAKSLDVQIAVDNFGNAVIKNVEVPKI